MENNNTIAISLAFFIMNYKLTFTVLLLAVLYTIYRQHQAKTSNHPAGHSLTSPSSISTSAATATSHTGEEFALRAVANVFAANSQAEGAGARVRRSIGTANVRNFTPFLMLDHFSVSPDAGFPDHPHRGQETITYMLKGRIDHEDFTGSAGTLEPGDLQFMTAGRGVVHAEMPRIDHELDGSITSVEGLQLWVDLPENLKECEPRYRDLRKKDIPIVSRPEDKLEVKVISGVSYGVESVRDLAYTPVWMLDVRLGPGGKFTQVIPQGFNAFLYIMDGSGIVIGGRQYKPFHSVFFKTSGDGIEVTVPDTSSGEARFAVVAGQMLDQEIVQHGPFVETSRERIVKAFRDYQGYTNGFERAKGWGSEIGKRMLG